jgi:hypothetical protein
VAKTGEAAPGRAMNLWRTSRGEETGLGEELEGQGGGGKARMWDEVEDCQPVVDQVQHLRN